MPRPGSVDCGLGRPLMFTVRLLGGIKFVVSWDGGFNGYEFYSISMISLLDQHNITFVSLAIGPVLAVVIVAAITDIFHLTISVIRASRAVTVTSLVVTVTTIILSRRVIAAAATRWRWRTSTSRRTLTTTTRSWSTITSRVKAPRCRRRSTGPLVELLAFYSGRSAVYYVGKVNRPQSLTHHLAQDACCASHDRHRLRHGDSHTQQRQTYLPC